MERHLMLETFYKMRTDYKKEIQKNPSYQKTGATKCSFGFKEYIIQIGMEEHSNSLLQMLYIFSNNDSKIEDDEWWVYPINAHTIDSKLELLQHRLDTINRVIENLEAQLEIETKEEEKGRNLFFLILGIVGLVFTVVAYVISKI